MSEEIGGGFSVTGPVLTPAVGGGVGVSVGWGRFAGVGMEGEWVVKRILQGKGEKERGTDLDCRMLDLMPLELKYVVVGTRRCVDFEGSGVLGSMRDSYMCCLEVLLKWLISDQLDGKSLEWSKIGFAGC